MNNKRFLERDILRIIIEEHKVPILRLWK